VKLVDDLLDASRVMTGKLALQVGEVDLEALLQDVVASQTLAAGAKSISLESGIASPVPRIKGDADRLRQVLWNLVSNAIKFTAPRGKIRVLAYPEPGRVRLEVGDTGKGIDSEFLPYVFERFRQEDSTITRKFGGLGLGLSIVRHIVELHGGEVSVASAGLGKGSTFTVLLPIPRPTVTSRHTGAHGNDEDTPTETTEDGDPKDVPKNKEQPLRDINILVVDDDADGRALVSKFLESEGARVRTAGSMDETIEELAQEPPDLLVADIGMPGKDGYSLLRSIRDSSSTRVATLPALAFTAYASEEDRRKALAAGFDDHLAKPLNPTALVGKLLALLHGERLVR
jgi:CheY-like chemotaxis protein